MKTKSIKIIPLWLSALCLTTSLQGAVFLLSLPPEYSAPRAPAHEPVVLGATNLIRGQEFVKKPGLKKIKEPDFSKIGAKSFLVLNLTDGKTLFEKDSDRPLGIASLTKLMTALVFYKEDGLNEILTVPSQGLVGISPNLGLVPGDRVKAIDLFNAMLIGSSNDAAQVLADFTAKKTRVAFVKLMNDYASILNMSSSRFSNPLGFDSKYNYSTAKDLGILISETEKISVFTDLSRIISYRFFGSLNKLYFTSTTNKLISSHPEIQAIKTGYTVGSGGAMATKIFTGGGEIVIIVLGSENREEDTLKLKDEFLTSYKWE